MTSTASSVAGAVPVDRAPVDDVTVILLPTVTGTPDLDHLVAVLDAVQAQTATPRRVLVAGFDQDREGAERVVRHPLTVQQRVPLLLRRPLGPDSPRWEAVEDARRGLPVDRGHWLWFLAPDSRPEPGALQALAAAARRSSRVGVVGPKLVREDDPRLLRSLGHHLTPAGRSTDTVHPGLVDQGQLDLRQDVLGVPLVGSLVDSSVLQAVDGLDRAFGEDGVDGLDLGWRSHLAGHRVVVAPDAVVRQGEDGLGVLDPLRTRRRERQLALARGPLWSTPWRRLGVALTSFLAVLALLLVKRPAEAAGEWADVRAALSPARGWGARRRFARRRTVRPRDLAGLHSPAGSGWRSTLETIGDALDPRARRSARDGAGRTGTRAGAATGPVSEEFADLAGEERRSRLSAPLALAVLVSMLVTAWWGRDLMGALHLGGVGLVGSELGAATTDAQGLLASALDGWRGGGLGHDRPAEPWLLPAAAATWLLSGLPGAGVHVAGPALAWLLALAAPLSVVSAYLALRRSTGGRWTRALLALAWAGLTPLTVSLAQGRVGPALVHVLAPLLVAGVAVCAVREGGVRRTAACFATVLGIALAALWVPAVLVLTTVGGLALLALGRGAARWRGAVLGLLPWGFLAPWLPAVLADPVRLAGGAGATVALTSVPSATPAWQTALLHPGGPLDAGSLQSLPLWLTVVLWLAALGALLVPGRAGRRAGVLVAVALLALTLALVATRTGLGRLPLEHPQGGLVVAAWPGTALSIAGAALLLAAGILLDRLLVADTAQVSRRWRTAAAVGVLVPVAVFSVWGLSPAQRPDGLQVADDPLPAVAAEQSRGAAALRTLVLEPAGAEASDTVHVDLLGTEPEPARILRDRTGDLAAGTSAGQTQVVQTVGTLVAGAAPDEVETAVTDLGAGYVLLRAPSGHPLAAQVDRVSGLTRVSSPPDQVLWRRTDADAARVRVIDAAGEPIGQLGVTGAHARAEGDLTGLPEAAGLRISEGPGWSRAARVTVDDEVIPVTAAGVVELPADAEQVQVEVLRPSTPWHLGVLGLLVVVGFLALPVGRTERTSATGGGTDGAEDVDGEAGADGTDDPGGHGPDDADGRRPEATPTKDGSR